ncbi:hypothetical protein SBP18_14390 [Rhodoferax ferrireducens]|uniref:hypothetical protein n=1 Tax=Rhodoferax ferrireducens TaxID=192843 RepID=UPI00298DE8FB|nr:hypothetical protein [Rhodoferax ferrireducens]WPC65672.1 hypothetical protein SBP18_14390 [Rhodoferax ferrireducens]
MLFTEEMLVDLKDDPLGGTVRAIELVRQNLNTSNEEWNEFEYGVLLEAYSLMSEVVAAGLLPILAPGFPISGDMHEDCGSINHYMTDIEQYCIKESSKVKVGSLRSHFKTAISSRFSYEFSQGDLDRVQALIGQIRNLIGRTEGLAEDHKRRLLSRLEKLQAEMHKKVSDLDRFWGLIGDAGVVLGKLGNDAKPIVDRIREVADIVWQTQSRAEELPSGTQIPMLGSNKGATNDGLNVTDSTEA